MNSNDSKKHVVRQGDNLVTIAQKYHLSSWKEIYFSPLNDAYRRKRHNPNLISPGDLLFIPPNALEILNMRLKNLLKTKEEALKMFKEIDTGIEKEFRIITNYSNSIDTIGTVANIVANITQLAWKGHKAVMNLHGKELAKANTEILKTHVENTTETVAGFVIPSQEPSSDDGLAWAVTKILWKSWQDMNSPAYWAGVLTGGSPEQSYTNAKKNLNNIRTLVIIKLDDKIRATRNEIEKIVREKSSALSPSLL